MKIRRSNERGSAKFGWLDSKHSFSFGSYYDPEHMGFGPLRVINDDRVSAGAGFPSHGHANMEIISYVVAGALQHKDSLGTGSVIVPGDVQRMTAGTGIHHSEWNASKSDQVRFLQIWIEPERDGLQPGYQQQRFYESEAQRNQWVLLGSREGREGSITIHNDIDLYGARLDAGNEQVVQHSLAENRMAWMQVVRGEIAFDDYLLKEGDGVAIESAMDLQIQNRGEAEILLFDMRK